MTRLRLALGLALIIAVACPPGVATGEEDSATEHPVMKALAAFSAKPPARFEGTIERPAAAPSAVRTVVVGDGGAAPYEGGFEVWRDGPENDEVVIVSKRFVPGFGIYEKDGEGVIETRRKEGERAIDAAGVRRGVLALIDTRRLTKWLRKASWKPLDGDAEDPGVSRRWSAEVSRRIVPPTTQGMAGISSVRVLRAEAELTLVRGTVSEIRVRVTETDPVAGLRRRAVRESGAELPPGFELDEGGDEGREITYVIRPASATVSKRLAQFRKRMRAASAPETGR